MIDWEGFWNSGFSEEVHLRLSVGEKGSTVSIYAVNAKFSKIVAF
jgi:hypothetical protein